jgi:serine/threonine-protein kinase
LGTAAYMSPEQAKGRPADKRSDIWAFGCVFYEMLTGRRAFDGEDVSETLASILKSDPDWRALPSDTPPPIRVLLQRCLERDRRRRVGDMAGVRFVLDDALSLAAAPTDSPRPDVDHQIAQAVTAAERRVMRRRVAPLVAAIVAIGALSAAALWRVWPQPPERAISRFSLALPEGQQFALIARPQVAISGDGAQLVYHTTQQLLYRQFADFQWRELVAGAAAQGANSPEFSPDGQSIAYYANSEGVIKRVAVAGGASTIVCRTPAPSTLSWDASGILFAAAGRIEAGNRGAVFRCRASGGEPEQIATLDAGEEVYGPRMLPGGKSLLFTVARPSDGLGRWDKAQIVLQSTAGGARKTLITGGSDARYVKSGHLLYAVSGVVFAAPFDVEREAVTGSAVPVLEGVRRSATANNGVAQFATSDTGTLVYVPGPVATGSNERTLAIADRSGTITRLPVDPAHYAHTRASPDGTRIIVGTDDGKQAIVWTYRLDGKTAMQRVTHSGNNRFPIWSPDGVRIAFQSDREGDAGIFVQRVDGVGGVERITNAAQGEVHVPESWAPDGRHILYGVEKDGVYSLRVLAVSQKASTQFGGVQSTEPSNAVFSPDGRWIAYTIGERGGVASPNRGVFVQPFPATGAIYQVPQQRLDFQPVWSPDGSVLFFVPSAASGQLAAVGVKRQEGVTFSSPTMFPARVTADRVSGERRAYDILPDGRFVGLLTVGETGRFTGTELRVVLNWFEELRQRAPVP